MSVPAPPASDSEKPKYYLPEGITAADIKKLRTPATIMKAIRTPLPNADFGGMPFTPVPTYDIYFENLVKWASGGATEKGYGFGLVKWAFKFEAHKSDRQSWLLACWQVAG